MIIIMPFCGVYRRFGFVFCYTRPPRFHEQHFPSSCEEKKELDSIKKEELDSIKKEETENQMDNRRAEWNKRRAKWEEYYNHVPPRKAMPLLPQTIPKAAPPQRPDTVLCGFPDRANAARDKDFRNEFRERWQEICPFLVIAVFTARLC